MPTTAPIVELADVWRAIRDRMRSVARLLVLGESRADTEAIAACFDGSGIEVVQAGNADEARQAIATHAPEVRLLAFGRPGDPTEQLLTAGEEAVGYPCIAVVPADAHGTAERVLAMGADDVLFRPLPSAERLRRLVAARVRQGVTLRLSGRMAEELWGQLGAQRGEERVGKMSAELESALAVHRTALEERGSRLLLADADPLRVSRVSAALEPLRAAVVTAGDAAEMMEVLRMATVDAAIVHVSIEEAGLAKVVTAMHQIDPYLQIALLEADDPAPANAALSVAAVTVCHEALSERGVFAGVLRRLVVARRSLDMLRKFADEVARRDPEILAYAHEIWRAAVFAAEPAQETQVERRIDERAPLEFPVVVETLPRGPVYEGSTLNLSLSGMFVAADVAIRVGTRVRCKVLVDDAVLELDGQVVRAGQALAADGGARGGFAVWFPRVDAATVRYLTSLFRRD